MKRLFFLFIAFVFSVTVSHGQQFGGSVLVHGSTILAGDGQSQVLPGIVYLYSLSQNGDWAETGRIMAPNPPDSADGFGMSIAVSGDMLLVGAPKATSVHLYRNVNQEWKYVSSVTNNSAGFGSVVAVSNHVAAVSAPGTADRPGSVWTFAISSSGMLEQEALFEQEKDDLNTQFGASVAILNDHVLIGAPGANQNSGSVMVVERQSDGTWSEVSPLPGLVSAEGALTGSVLMVSGDHLAVGSPGFGNRSGAVWIFSRSEDKFELKTRLSAYSSSRNDLFGSSIAFGDHEIWVGAPGEGGRRGTGAVYQFDLDADGMPSGTSKMSVSNLDVGSAFGSTLALGKEIAAVGASGIDNRAGAVIPLRLRDGEWARGSNLYDDTEGYDSMAGELVECKDDYALDFPCKDVDMTSFVSMKDLGADRGIRTNDLWGWEDPETGREYAIVGLSNATSFVDVTDVYNPKYLGILPMPSTATISVWRDMKVYKDHAYIVSDGAGEHGMQVFDLRQLRDVTTPVTFEETNHYPNIFSAHNIVINEETGFGYSVGSSAGGETCGGGLHMIDLKDPANPVFAGCFSDGSTGRRGTGYSHDAQCVVYRGPDADYVGNEICLGSNETALSIADVTNKEAPYSISIATYPNVAYAHQGWLTDDHRYFYLNDELDEAGNLVPGTRTLIWDLTDLDEPVLANEFVAKTTETDHNLYVKGNLMYKSNTSAGLRILDITDPENPFETAYFDTSPVGGRGVSWSNYPYFKSGSIVVTGGHYGLFLLKKKEVDL